LGPVGEPLGPQLARIRGEAVVPLASPGVKVSVLLVLLIAVIFLATPSSLYSTQSLTA
jgi:hypothetical protein